jgi:hypothetical protein
VARLFVHRARFHALWRPLEAGASHRAWEVAPGVLYGMGGAFFVVGSVFFFPALAAEIDVGVWLFIAGSLVYLTVTGFDAAEVGRAYRARELHPSVPPREVVAAVSYLAGTVLFTVGSVFFLDAVALIAAGAACFVVGSLLFVVGATINVLQIVDAPSRRVLQLMNLTAVTFLVGSVLFTTASVPYGWSWQSAADRSTTYAFLALQFVVGSALFLAGGLFNLRRAWLFGRA